MTKFCGNCKQDKLIDLFARNSQKKDGLQTTCKPCQTEYGKARYQQHKPIYLERNRKTRIRNQIFIHEYLESHPCVDCGETDAVVLTFDHVRGEKRGNISEMSKHSWALRSVMDEIAKCEVRCFNCHMRKDCVRIGSYKWKLKLAAPKFSKS
jgi:hypothetical protein